MILQTFAKWGPGTYRRILGYITVVESYKRFGESQINECFVQLIRDGFLIPHGTAIGSLDEGEVVWTLKNRNKYLVHPWLEPGPDCDMRCLCGKFGELPADGRDPGMPWVKFPLWKESDYKL